MKVSLETIVDRILEAYEQAPLSDAIKALVDTVAVTAAAPGVDGEARRYALVLAGGEEGSSPVLGLWVRRSRLNAAVANAFLAHSIEYDDWLAPGYVHVGSVSVPVALSYIGGHTLREVLKTLSAAYESALIIGSLMGRNHYVSWHSTASVGSVAAAVTYSLLSAGPDPGVVSASISHALNYMGGLWKVNDVGALYKPSSPAHAVQTGLLSGMITGVGKSVIPGVLGEVCRLLKGECRWREFESYGVSLNGFKFYPSCRHSHTVVEAAEKVHGEVDINRVTRIVVRVFNEAIVVAGKRNPKTIAEARFSIPYLVAATLVYGRLDFNTLRNGLRDPLVQRLMGMVELTEDPEYTASYPDKQPAILIVSQGDVSVESYVEYPKGDPNRGVVLKDILVKARGLSAQAGDRRVAELALTLSKTPLDMELTGILEAFTSSG